MKHGEIAEQTTSFRRKAAFKQHEKETGRKILDGSELSKIIKKQGDLDQYK